MAGSQRAEARAAYLIESRVEANKYGLPAPTQAYLDRHAEVAEFIFRRKAALRVKDGVDPNDEATIREKKRLALASQSRIEEEHRIWTQAQNRSVPVAPKHPTETTQTAISGRPWWLWPAAA